MDSNLGIWFEHHGGIIMFNDNGFRLQCSPGVVVLQLWNGCYEMAMAHLLLACSLDVPMVGCKEAGPNHQQRFKRSTNTTPR